jgi:hypothetical protein
VLLLVVTAEGASRIAALEAAAAETTPYDEYITRVQTFVPPGARVLGLHNYWLGLHDLDYRSWAVPLMQADLADWSGPLSVEVALDKLSPDVILVDARIRAYFENAPETDLKIQAVQDWMERRGYERVAVIDDSTYGVMEIFHATGAAKR